MCETPLGNHWDHLSPLAMPSFLLLTTMKAASHMPSLGPNHDMVMPSSICHYLSWHGHGLIMLQRRHDMVVAIMLQSSAPLCCSTPVTTSIGVQFSRELQHLRGEKAEEEEDGQGWVSGHTGHRPPPHLHSCWPDLMLAAMLHSHWLGSRPAAF